jgi:hypothetical protein
MLTPPARPHATHGCRARSRGICCTPRIARHTSLSSTEISGIHCAHATWHQRPSAHCLNAPSCTGHSTHDTPRNIASFSSSEGRGAPAGVVAAAAATAGVFALPRSHASRHTQHSHPLGCSARFSAPFSFSFPAHAASPAATLFTP